MYRAGDKKYPLESLGRSIQQRSLMQDTRCSHRGQNFLYWMSLNPEGERKVRTKWLMPSKRGGEGVWPLGEGTTVNVFPQTIFIGPLALHTFGLFETPRLRVSLGYLQSTSLGAHHSAARSALLLGSRRTSPQSPAIFSSVLPFHV